MFFLLRFLLRRTPCVDSNRIMCSPLNIHTWSKVKAKMLLVGGRSWTAHVSPCGNCAASPCSEQPIERRLETLVLVSPLRGDVGLRSTLNQTRTLPSVWRVSRSAPSRTPTRGLNLSRVLAQRRVQSRERKRDACTENLRTSQDAQDNLFSGIDLPESG